MFAQQNNTCPTELLRHIILIEEPQLAHHKHFQHADIICQALLPEIRTTAQLIAAKRHDFNQVSPKRFTDEADFLAAQILILRAKTVHLCAQKMPLLNIANQRAQAFAQEHHLPFQPAQGELLGTDLPQNSLLFSCALIGRRQHNPIDNTLALKKQLNTMKQS